MNPRNLYHYILGFVFSITWLPTGATKAIAQPNVHLTTSPPTSNATWYPYPVSIQLRSGCMLHKNMNRSTADAIQPLPNEKPLAIIPTTIDVDILYAHSLFANHLESYPRIGLSFLMPYALQKGKQHKFPNTWGILTYIELYQSHPIMSTWGNRIGIGATKGGTLARAEDQPNYSFLATKEITYHWLYTPSLQVNFGIGLLINWWTKNRQDRPKVNKANTTDQLHANRQPLNNANNNNDAMNLKFAPMATIGMRYIIHSEPLLKLGNSPTHYRKRKSSRIDCSIAGSSRRLASTQKYYFIFRGSSLLSFAINTHNALLCSIELGYNWYKKALLANMLPGGGIEATPLLGYEIRYGRYLLQFQLGCEITDSKKPKTGSSDEDKDADNIFNILNKMNKTCTFSVNAQYMVTDHFFMGISARSQEIPALRLGISL